MAARSPNSRAASPPPCYQQAREQCVFACPRHRVSSPSAESTSLVPGICLVHLKRTGTSNRAKVRVGSLVGPEMEVGRGDVHPGRVGRDNHRTDTDMLIPESFTRDI